MIEIRHNPVTNTIVAVSTKRLDRTFMPPKDYCPLCPTKKGGFKTEIPDEDYDIVVFENKFPPFSNRLSSAVSTKPGLYKKERSGGSCEVVCYNSDHEKYMEDSPIEKIEHIIRVWSDRYLKLGKDRSIKYVLIFENKGKEIGVTIPHPHGQIYALPYIPTLIATELNSSRDYLIKNKRCLHCDIIAEEIKDGRRIISKNNDFISFIPFYARYPYEVHIYPLRHYPDIFNLQCTEISSLAAILKDLIKRYNSLFGFRMPYMMVIHQGPTDKKDHNYYHLHFEFYPPYRSKDKLKYLAGFETGAGDFINDTLPEEKAEELRDIKI